MCRIRSDAEEEVGYCGQYIETSRLGWTVVVVSWLFGLGSVVALIGVIVTTRQSKRATVGGKIMQWSQQNKGTHLKQHLIVILVVLKKTRYVKVSHTRKKKLFAGEEFE